MTALPRVIVGHVALRERKTQDERSPFALQKWTRSHMDAALQLKDVPLPETRKQN